MLKELGAPKAKVVRIGNTTPRGYETDALRQVCTRYAPQNSLNTPLATATPQQVNNDAAKFESQPQQPKSHVAVDNSVSASKYAACCGVAVETPPEREKEQKPVENSPCYHVLDLNDETPSNVDSMATLSRMNKARHGKVIQAAAETARDMMGG